MKALVRFFKIVLFFGLILAVAFLGLNYLFHQKAQNLALKVFYMTQKVFPSESVQVRKVKTAILGTSESEFNTKDGKTIFRTHTDLNPLHDYIEVEYLSHLPHAIPIRFKLTAEPHSFQSLDFILTAENIKNTSSDYSFEINGLKTKANLPLKSLIQPKSITLDLIKNGISTQITSAKITNLKNQKTIFSLDQFNHHQKYEFSTKDQFKDRTLTQIKQITLFPGEEEEIALGEFQLDFSLGQMKWDELQKAQELIQQSQAQGMDRKNPLILLSLVRKIFDSVQLQLGVTGKLNQEPLNFSTQLEVSKDLNPMDWMNQIKAQVQFDLPQKIVQSLARKFIAKKIKAYFLERFEPLFDLNNKALSDRMIQVIEKKIPQELVSQLLDYTQELELIRPSSPPAQGLHLDYQLAFGTHLINGKSKNLQQEEKKIISFFEDEFKKRDRSQKNAEILDLYQSLTEAGLTFKQKGVPIRRP